LTRRSGVSAVAAAIVARAVVPAVAVVVMVVVARMCVMPRLMPGRIVRAVARLRHAGAAGHPCRERGQGRGGHELCLEDSLPPS